MSRRPGGRQGTPTSAGRRLGRNVNSGPPHKATCTPAAATSTASISLSSIRGPSINNSPRRGSLTQSQLDDEEEERERLEIERSKIASAFGERFQSIGDLRRQIDSLQNKHKAEELALIDTMQSLLQQNRTESETSLKKIRKEMNEKQQAVDLYNQFKDQGGDIIQRLSSTLTDLQQKYAEDGKRCVELQKRVIELEQDLRDERSHRFGLEHQLAQLRHLEVAQPNLTSNNTSERERRLTAEKLVEALSQKSENQQILKLQQLIREKDAALVMLNDQQSRQPSTPRNPDSPPWESKYKALETKYSNTLNEYQVILAKQEQLTAQTEEHNKVLRGQVKDLEAKLNYITTEGADQYDETSAIVRTVLSEDPDAESMPILENKVVRMLVQQLKSEKRQRLETEEQSSTMLQEASKTVNTLEQRLKQAETPRIRRKNTTPIQPVPQQPSPVETVDTSSPVDDLSVEETLEKWARLRPTSQSAYEPTSKPVQSTLIEISPPRVDRQTAVHPQPGMAGGHQPAPTHSRSTTANITPEPTAKAAPVAAVPASALSVNPVATKPATIPPNTTPTAVPPKTSTHIKNTSMKGVGSKQGHGKGLLERLRRHLNETSIVENNTSQLQSDSVVTVPDAVTPSAAVTRPKPVSPSSVPQKNFDQPPIRTASSPARTPSVVSPNNQQHVSVNSNSSPGTKACKDSIYELEKQLEDLLKDFKS